mmetsp:Transcript_19844/g.38892  ORF Transcript_19844/g.38892 Transcript_19844/m.38892 type:complete len:495 (-) Transcript_19844:618-2102(-)
MQAANPRLNRENLDPDVLAISQGNLDEVRELIPRVMEQLTSDRDSFERSGQHPKMKFIAEETERYLMDLQGWASRAEDLLEQQAAEQARGSSHDSEEDEDDDEDDAMSGASDDNNNNGRSGGSFQQMQHQQMQQQMQMQPGIGGMMLGASGAQDNAAGGTLLRARVQRGRFTVGTSHGQRVMEGLTDGNGYFLFERVIRDTIYGNIIRSVRATRSSDGNQLTPSDQQVAIKVFQLQLVKSGRARGGQPVQENPLDELSFQQRLSRPGHRNVLSLLGCFEDPDYLYAVLPLAGAELFELIATRGPFSEAQARPLFRDMLSALVYVHDHGIAHRDVSPENFLMDLQTGRHPILIDFGLAIRMDRATPGMAGQDLDRPQVWAPIRHTGFVGKVLYAAPEMWGNLPYDGPSVDLWSAAVTLFVCIFQAPPWERARASRRRDGYVNIVLQHQLRAVLRTWNFPASDSLIDLLQGIFREDPRERFSLQTVLQHPWLHEDT